MARGKVKNNGKPDGPDKSTALGFEARLWAMADKLRSNMDAAEYKHVVLGLIFLKFISDKFSAKYEDLSARQKTDFTDPEERDEYVAENVFWVPKGVFHPDRFLDLVINFGAYEVRDGAARAKKLAGYHQFHAVNKAVRATESATVTSSHKAGVIWHTQGSGKSLTMAFYASKLERSERLKNPTIVVVTDRNDLDDQLFGTFAEAHHAAAHRTRSAARRDAGRRDEHRDGC